MVISLVYALNVPFRGLYAISNLSDDLNPEESNAVKNAGCWVASNSMYAIESLEPEYEVFLLDSDF